MKHIPATSRPNRETAKLVRLALALQASGSQLESQSWQSQINQLIATLFQKKQNETLEQALDYLWTENPLACDVLAQLIESYAESIVNLADIDAVLIAIPFLVWSRYAIPTGQINKQRMGELREHIMTHLLAGSARLSIANVLFSPDQLPRGFTETRALLKQLTQNALIGEDLHLDNELIAASEFVADVRYIFAAVVVEKGGSLFRWQQADITQSEVLQTWQLHTKTTFAAMLPGCHFQGLLPNAFFSAWRKLEHEARIFSLHAGISYLCEMMNVAPMDLRAIIAPFYDLVLEEYRVGFTLLASSEVLHGVVWPLIGDESEETDMVSQIEQELKALGKVAILSTAMPMEFCDDCGSPLFPNVDGELVHPQMPESASEMPQLH